MPPTARLLLEWIVRIVALRGRTAKLLSVLCIACIAELLGSADGRAQAPAAAGPQTYAELPTEIPADFVPTADGFDFERREEMIPMRDGVKLHTVILVPKGAHRAPILLTRTPYDAKSLTSHAESPHLEAVLTGYDNATDVIVEGGYIRVVQDIRGKHGSEGDYVVNRPLRGPQNATPVDHATDTYDTVDWLVKNVPESNGRVGILGISYDGFLPLMALVDPHPALKVSVPMNPMVDGWIGDDWFHNGAFRQLNASWIYNQVATRAGATKWWLSHLDMYDMFMDAGSAGELGRRRGLDRTGFWRKLTEHPAYDAFWQDQAVDKVLAARPLKIPVMLVHGQWDQEDIYGAPAVYKALEPKDSNNDMVFFVMGPWYHGQQINDGSQLGAINFHSDTALHFRREILRPFLDHYLKDDAPPANVAAVNIFETGTNRWQQLDAWPKKEVKPTRYHLRAGLRVETAPPGAADEPYAEYVSDPTKPVPFRSRPVQPMGYGNGNTWSEWLVDDQREASGRTDVLAFVSETLTAPLRIGGEPVANLVASTSGTDSDWVVKLIDVYPAEVPSQPDMVGYQLIVSGDIFRGRYHESFEKAVAVPANQPLTYRFALPTASLEIPRGHGV